MDLRDGNQALACPLTIAEKLEFFDMLVRIGFKEIEIGFPASSDTEYRFCRTLIADNRILDDVVIQVLCPTRLDLIQRTIEALRGARHVIFHLYTCTSPLQRRLVFNLDRDRVKQMAVDGVLALKRALGGMEAGGTRVDLEYSMESFSSTEPEFALAVAEAVTDVWDGPLILNLPATVECAPAGRFADQVEWMGRHLTRRASTVLSVHPHNDRGTVVAAAEQALQAGVERVEGTLFGNGERTGNLDLVTLALNLFTQGIDPELDLSDLDRIRAVYERLTKLRVPPRHPYAGDAVFTAFSGAHQDAIRKSWQYRDPWQVLYVPIDPADIGRSRDGIIRINAQSGKGGAAFVLEQRCGVVLEKDEQRRFGKLVKQYADLKGAELTEDEVVALFEDGHHRRPCSTVD